MPEFKYEIALSFLGSDEPTARRISELIAPRVSTTFVYSERQLELAGTDGLVSCSEAFSRDARTVAILWRPAWGTTKFTQVEETAIKNRFFHEGPEFVTLVAMEKPAVPPVWFPQSRLWADLGLLGDQGLAGVLLERVRANGAVVREESAVENAARLARELEAAGVRNQLRNSPEGVAAAIAAHGTFEAELRRIAQAAGIRVFEARQGTPLTLRHHDHSLQSSWQTRYADSLQHAALRVTFYRPGTQDQCDFEFRIMSASDMAWSEMGRPGKMYSSEQLADECVIRLLDYIRRKLLVE